MTLILWGVLAPAAAAPLECPEHFVSGQAPHLLNPKLAVTTHPLCFSGYATLFSGVVRTPLWSAEHLTVDRIAAARVLIRVNPFHPEPRLPDNVRSELADYRGSGYDRGHMAPNGDMPDAGSQRESSSLANMIPQDHDDNAHLWAAIEGAVRDQAAVDGEVYVVTGPLFQGEDLEVLNDRVTVPTGIWKAVYDPVSGEAGAYVVDNRPGDDYTTMSIAALERRSGIDPFPALSAAVKDAAPDLAAPQLLKRGRRRGAED